VLALNILDSLAALEVFSDVASMGLTAARNRSVRLDNISGGDGRGSCRYPALFSFCHFVFIGVLWLLS
jgi:hypothetical protein